MLAFIIKDSLNNVLFVVMAKNPKHGNMYIFKSVFPDLLEFGKHLLIKLNKSSLILKNNPAFSLEFDFFFGKYLMNARQTLVVLGAMVGNH